MDGEDAVYSEGARVGFIGAAQVWLQPTSLPFVTPMSPTTVPSAS